MPLRQLFGVQGGPLPFPMQQLLQGVPNFSPDMSVGEFMPFMAQASKNGQLPFSPAPDGQGGVKRKLDDVQVRTLLHTGPTGMGVMHTPTSERGCISRSVQPSHFWRAVRS